MLMDSYTVDMISFYCALTVLDSTNIAMLKTCGFTLVLVILHSITRDIASQEWPASEKAVFTYLRVNWNTGIKHC